MRREIKPPVVEPLSDRQERALAKWSAFLKQAAEEFGPRNRISDFHTLCKVAANEGGWPRVETFSESDRLELFNETSRRPGFGMIEQRPGPNGGMYLTEKGREVVQRLVDAMDDAGTTM